jgi:cyclopropane fatty-acyl-phospholipid synthase-like methyltransferase
MNRWEKFAQEDAEYYILSVDEVRSQDGLKYFFESGERDTTETLKNVDTLEQRDRCLEIGCGIGRLTFPHSRQFKEVSVVEISETMLSKLKKLATEKQIQNIRTYLFHENWDQPGAYNYVYSYEVFQHIQDLGIIESYIRRISSSLHAHNRVQVHFDTRPQHLLYIIRNMLPDFLLPKLQRKGIRRIRRKSSLLKKIFAAHGLTVIREIKPDTESHIFILTKK